MTYAIDSIGANPYFQTAYMSPNLNFMGVPQTVTPSTVPTDTTENITPDSTVSRRAEEKKSNNTAKYVIGIAATLGAAYLCRKAYKVGNGTGAMEKMMDGFGQWCKSATNWVKGTKDKIVNPQKFSVSQVGDQTVCTVPGKHNIVKGAEGAAEKLGQIGVTADAPALLDSTGKLAEGIKIKNGKFKHGENIIEVVKGKVSGCWAPVKDAAGNITGYEKMSADAFRDFYSLPKSQAGLDLQKAINEALGKFKKGELIGQEGTVITQFSHTKDGVGRLFNLNGSNYELRSALSNKFNVNSDAVNALRHDNSAVDTALKAFGEHKTDGLKLVSAEYTRPDLGTLYIKNGEITSIKWTDGQVYEKGSEKWKALMQTNKDIYENILKDTESLQNRVYQLA